MSRIVSIVAVTAYAIAAVILWLLLAEGYIQRAEYFDQNPVQTHRHSSNAFTALPLDPARLNLLNVESAKEERVNVASRKNRRLHSCEKMLNSDCGDDDEKPTTGSNEMTKHSGVRPDVVSGVVPPVGNGIINPLGGMIPAKEVLEEGSQFLDNRFKLKFPVIQSKLSGDPNLHFVESPALAPPEVNMQDAYRKFRPSWLSLIGDNEKQWPTFCNLDQSRFSVLLNEIITGYEAELSGPLAVFDQYYEKVKRHIVP